MLTLLHQDTNSVNDCGSASKVDPETASTSINVISVSYGEEREGTFGAEKGQNWNPIHNPFEQTNKSFSGCSAVEPPHILVTAQRPGEVIGMRTTEIDGRWWTIPSERAKNGRSHRIYLTDLALGLIGETEGKDFLFPYPHKDKIKKIEAHALGVAVRRNLAWPITDSKGKPLFDADGKPATENKLGIDQFTPHDLRRTTATFLAEMGTMDEVIDAVLNHAKQGVIKVYNQYRYDKEKQMALEAWERKLNSIIAGTKNNVISIRNHKKPA